MNRIRFDPDTPFSKTSLHRAFGYVIHMVELNAGSVVKADSDGGPRGESANVTIWTKGRLEVAPELDPEDIQTRLPGQFSLDLQNLRSGKMISTAIEDTEWWCVNYDTNWNRLPALTAFRLGQGETTHLVKGTQLFICEGTLEINNLTKGQAANISVVSNNGVDAIALTQVYGLIFS